jgi:hypothetical protein
MESSLARLRLELKFYIIAWKARDEKIGRLDWLNWKKFRLKKLDILEAKNIFLRLNKNHFSCKKRTNWDPSATDVSNGDLTLEKEVFQFLLARLEKLDF